ncbi:hypothetical protein N7510_002787 [Penicillium lagena]|uniref:uncharacterized protein n=1 Tax=Penicillium lagena TaxID=94218 RepID=UPI002540D472|nr:uncharacterized protein N7510_002787 [Penicillium lagena]KAJ5618803.1 hypothetical protein N7510_002787 [Penicillium lagena]
MGSHERQDVTSALVSLFPPVALSHGWVSRPMVFALCCTSIGVKLKAASISVLFWRLTESKDDAFRARDVEFIKGPRQTLPTNLRIPGSSSAPLTLDTKMG